MSRNVGANSTRWMYLAVLAVVALAALSAVLLMAGDEWGGSPLASWSTGWDTYQLEDDEWPPLV